MERHGTSVDGFLQNLPRLWSSGQDSDHTAVCRDREFKLHRAIVRGQSKYFDALWSKQWDSQQPNHFDEDPAVMEAMFRYFYHFDLPDDTIPEGCSASVWFITIYAIADKYDVFQLRELAIEELDWSLSCRTRDVDNFIEVIRTVDQCTAGRSLWDIILPHVKGAAKTLFNDESFVTFLDTMPDFSRMLLHYLESTAHIDSVVYPDRG